MGLMSKLDLTSFWSIPSFGFGHGGGAATASGNGLEFREYYASACPHCQDMDPIWKEAAKGYSGPVAFKQIECADDNWNPVASNASLCKGVHAFPTMKLYQNGSEIAAFNGERSPSALVKFAQAHEAVHTQAMPLALGMLAAPPVKTSRRSQSPSESMANFL
mmetsp:Transcript_64581/g.154312  ORF Transcript_64581/g.154312 Transcript_64581/m.154312 type:complete len:162 (-) Transcript_64581:114-599(-)